MKDLHSEARLLLTRRLVERISDTEESWLLKHLAECTSCVAAAAETDNAIRRLRGIHVDLPEGLAGRTQLRVRLRAEELQEQRSTNKLLWVFGVVSWALGVASAPLVWRGFAWAGEYLGLPKPIWVAGAVLWWTVPILLAAGTVLLEKTAAREWNAGGRG